MSGQLHSNLVKAALTCEPAEWRERAMFRAATRRALYIWTKAITCYNERPNLMTAEVFKSSCDWIQRIVTKTKRGLIEDPRGHIKTTRTTDSIPGWVAAQRPHEELDFPEEIERANAFLAEHPHLRGVDSRIVVGSDAKTRAAIFVDASRKHYESNPILLWAFPELIWDNVNIRNYGRWNAEEYSLPGRINPLIRDDYVRAVGIDSKEQGGRAEILLLDDLVGESNYRSVTEIDRRRRWVKTVGNLLENADYNQPAGGVILVIENRWGLDDVNSMIHNEMTDWDIWRRGAYRCYVHGTGNCGRWRSDEETTCAETDTPLWIERYPDAESLERVRRDKGDEVFDAQWRNDPTRSAEMNASSFKEFTVEIRDVRDTANARVRLWCAVVRVLDENGRPKPEEIIPLNALSGHFISIDPASSREKGAARTAASWFAFDRPTNRVFWLDCVAARWSPKEAVGHAYRLWTTACDLSGVEPGILIEKVAAQGYMSAALQYLARSDRSRTRLLREPEMIPPAHGEQKDDRIRRRTGWRLEQGLLFLRSGIQLPRTEVRHFPTGTKDALDTQAQVEEKYLTMLPARTDSDRLLAVRRRRRRMARNASGQAGVF